MQEGAIAAPPGMLPLRVRPLAVLTAWLDPPQRLGHTPEGDRKIVPVAGGSVSGERLSGEILPFGGDWAVTRADGVLLLDVRLTLRLDGGALVNVAYTGMRHGPDAVMARLAAGDAVDPSDYYFRIQPRFETAHPDYLWLNRLLAIGVGERLAEGPRYHVYEVL
ncbi:DUF3237 domain-containing protein [Rhodosalinus halophilus]|nr:DUF3237 domain-containing protein [Rhodosalinus halophilus]